MKKMKIIFAYILFSIISCKGNACLLKRVQKPARLKIVRYQKGKFGTACKNEGLKREAMKYDIL